MDFKVKFLQIQKNIWTGLLHEEVSLKTPNARAMLSGQSPSETIDGGGKLRSNKRGRRPWNNPSAIRLHPNPPLPSSIDLVRTPATLLASSYYFSPFISIAYLKMPPFIMLTLGIYSSSNCTQLFSTSIFPGSGIDDDTDYDADDNDDSDGDYKAGRQYQIPRCLKWQLGVVGRIGTERCRLRTTHPPTTINPDFITGFYCRQYVNCQAFIHVQIWLWVCPIYTWFTIQSKDIWLHKKAH